MSNGLHALKGFDYQVTVTLDVLLQHYGNDSASGTLARPEGEDDLVLSSGGPDQPSCEYVQIKKPREDGDGKLTLSPWSVVDVVRDLLPGTMNHLRGNQHCQKWILGDEVDGEISALLDAGLSAPSVSTSSYVTVLHLLARNQTSVPAAAMPSESKNTRGKAKGRLDRWRPATLAGIAPATAIERAADAFVKESLAESVPMEVCESYRRAMSAMHADLPAALSRTTALCTYGTEQQIRERVQHRLAQRYSLSLDVVRNSLIRNLRGFVQDIATQRDRWIDREEFELELRSVWPSMNLIAEPPAIEPSEIGRSLLVEQVLKGSSTGGLEVTGVSGSGKTKLASAVLAKARSASHGVHALYLEVRPEHQLRNVLAGVAFHLRRFGVTAPFRLVANHNASDERALRELARSLSDASIPVLLLLDLVEGTCSDAFARQLAIFLDELAPPVGLVVFGQESAFRALSALDRAARGIPPSLDLPGFDFDEFLALVERLSAIAPDRNELWRIFQTVTGGRSAGLYARLADALARCESVERMQQLAALPRDEVLAQADRARYLNISAELRDSTDRIVCFALPFRREEAERIFPGMRTADGVRELLQRGLLRTHDSDLLEMHETVRAGLERLAPLATRTQAHAALATHYENELNHTALVYHLERAGREGDAHRLARQAFVNGQQPVALAPYIAKHKLVSADELVASLVGTELPEHVYLVPELLKRLGHPRTSDTLLEEIRNQGARFQADHRWAWLMIEAVLACDAAKLEALVNFGLERPKSDGPNALEHIAHAARRCLVVVTPGLLQLFARQPTEIKVRLVSILLLDTRREVLSPILSFVADYDVPESGNRRRGGWPWTTSLETPLRLQRTEHVEELLAAIPVPEVSQTMISKAVSFGGLERWIWAARHALHADCLRILERGEKPDVILENALRILVFLGDTKAVGLAEQYAGKRSRLGNLATFVPALLSTASNPARYRAQLLDLKRTQDERMGDLSILLHLGSDAADLFEQLSRVDPDRIKLWRWLLVMHAALRPWNGAIKILEEVLTERIEDKDNLLFGPIVMKIGELPGAEVTDFLLRQLQHPWHSIRAFASLSLLARRSSHALTTLLSLSASEENPDIAKQMLVAAVASGPTSMSRFDNLWHRRRDATIWRLVLANRLKASSEADYLVAVAIDRTQHWQRRRAAILAATKLPFELALNKIYPSLLRERSTFTLDTHPSLRMHERLAVFLLKDAKSLHTHFVSGRRRFVISIGSILTELAGNEHGIVPGQKAAAWLYKRLSTHRWTTDRTAPNVVLNELHVPILHAAVLRGLRCSGRHDLLEGLIPTADSVWLLSRVIMECKRGRKLVPEDHERIGKLAASNPCSTNYAIKNILRNTTPPPPTESGPAVEAASPQGPTELLFSDVERLLTSGGTVGNEDLVLVNITEPQLSLLAEELNPANDFPKRWVASKPALGFTDGGFTVQGSRAESVPKHREAREKLRPALVAANRFRAKIPWHVDLLQVGGTWSRAHAGEQYVAALLRCLKAQGDPDRLYQELDENGDALFPFFDDVLRIEPIRGLLDARAVPFLLRYVNAGTEDLFESLCWMASQIDVPAIDPVLSALFARWVHRFDRNAERPQRGQSYAFWRSFGAIRRHPRFRTIPDYDLRLAELLRLDIVWFHRRDLVEAISDSPRTYIHHETMLFRAASFEHWPRDDVDRLDETADALFVATRDDAQPDPSTVTQ